MGKMRVLSTMNGPVMIDRESYNEELENRRMQLKKMIHPSEENRTQKGARAMERALGEDDGMVPPQNIEDMPIPPVKESSTSADVALSLFDLSNLLAKTRLPRSIRSLYTRAIVMAQAYNLPSMLDYVYTDLALRIPEDGKARKEVLIPLENMLRGERLKAGEKNPQI